MPGNCMLPMIFLAPGGLVSSIAEEKNAKKGIESETA